MCTTYTPLCVALLSYSYIRRTKRFCHKSPLDKIYMFSVLLLLFHVTQQRSTATLILDYHLNSTAQYSPHRTPFALFNLVDNIYLLYLPSRLHNVDILWWMEYITQLPIHGSSATTTTRSALKARIFSHFNLRCALLIVPWHVHCVCILVTW